MKRLFEGIVNFIYRLFFTRDDDLDVLQLLFAVLLIVAMRSAWIVIVATDMSDPVRIEGLVQLRWIIGLLVITAIPKWLVPSMVSVLSKNQIGEDRNRHGGGYGGGYGGGGYPDPYGGGYPGPGRRFEVDPNMPGIPPEAGEPPIEDMPGIPMQPPPEEFPQ